MSENTLTAEEIAELQKKAHAYDSEKGRLRKAQEELEAERAKRVQLEHRLSLSDDKGEVDPDVLEVFGENGVSILGKAMTPVMNRLDLVTKKLEEREQADTQAKQLQNFRSELDKILDENSLPGFTSRIYGGDLATLWDKFAEEHPLVVSAQTAGDVKTVSELVGLFITQNRDRVVGGGVSPMSGATHVIQSDYSDEDYFRDQKSLKQKLDNCLITEEEYRKQDALIAQKYMDAQDKLMNAATSYGLV